MHKETEWKPPTVAEIQNMNRAGRRMWAKRLKLNLKIPGIDTGKVELEKRRKDDEKSKVKRKFKLW